MFFFLFAHDPLSPSKAMPMVIHTTVTYGRLDSVEWNGGMERWNGIVEWWNTGTVE